MNLLSVLLLHLWFICTRCSSPLHYYTFVSPAIATHHVTSCRLLLLLRQRHCGDHAYPQHCFCAAAHCDELFSHVQEPAREVDEDNPHDFRSVHSLAYDVGGDTQYDYASKRSCSSCPLKFPFGGTP